MINTTNIKPIVEGVSNLFVDSVQAAKKIIVDTTVKHEPSAKLLNDFVDAQTEYTKNAVSAAIKFGTGVYDQTFNFVKKDAE